jgi:hypothetical protein
MSRKVLCGLALGGLMAAMTFAIPMMSSLSASLVIALVQRSILVLLLPGIIGAGAASGNVHAWPLWIAAGLNMSIYFVIGWLSCWTGMKLLGSRA